MDNLEPPIKYTKVDTVHILRTKIIDSMRVREVAASSKRESFQEGGEKHALGGVDVDFRHDLKRRRTDEGDDSDQVNPSHALATVLSQALLPLSTVLLDINQITLSRASGVEVQPASQYNGGQGRRRRSTSMEDDKDVDGDQRAVAEEEVAGMGDAGVGARSTRTVVTIREGQEATALMMSKALGEYGKELTVQQDAKMFLETTASQFLGGLLEKPQLAGSLDSKQVQEAVDGWIQGDVGLDVSRINTTMRVFPSRAIHFRQLSQVL